MARIKLNKKSQKKLPKKRKIRKNQRSTDLLIPRMPFQRLIREIVQNMTNSVFRIQAAALLALQEETEEYLVDLFKWARLLARHAKRATIMPKDMDA